MLNNRAKDDSGITMVIVTLALVGLMVMAALAIDLGAVYNERRIDQSTADAAATSGGVQFLRSQTAQAAVSEVVAKVDVDLGRTVTPAEWTACTDTNQLANTAAELGLTPATQCISFANGFGRLRVTLPTQDVGTSFARVIGIDSFTSSAFAEVSLAPLGGGTLPFVVLSGAANGDFICLRTDGTGNDEPPDITPQPPYSTGFSLDPCNELSYATSQGGRGTLIPELYQQGCGSKGNQSIVDAIMVGVDHPLGEFKPAITDMGPGDDANVYDSDLRARLDDDDCPIPFPNSVDVDTGFTSKLLYCALLKVSCPNGSAGVSSTRGRLSVSSSDSSFDGLLIDDVPLWDYFLGTLPAGTPTACNDAKTISSSGANFYTKRAALAACLEQWTSGQLFGLDIADSRRLGFVPRIAELGLCRTQPNPPPPDGGCGGGPLPDHVHINTFAPVYIDGVYENGNALCDPDNPSTPPPPATPSEWAIHYPGKAGGLDCSTSGPKDEIARLSGIVVPCGALPREVCDPSSSNAPFPDALGIIKVRLAK